jgi:hypothetical protein
MERYSEGTRVSGGLLIVGCVQGQRPLILIDSTSGFSVLNIDAAQVAKLSAVIIALSLSESSRA